MAETGQKQSDAAGLWMLNPEVDRQYWFVHPNSPHIVHTAESAAAAAAVATPIPVWFCCFDAIEHDYIQSFVRSLDDGAYVLETIYENSPGVWRRALTDLYETGYYEVEEARAAGLIPPDWEVPQEVRDSHVHTPRQILRQRSE
jgi:hypothetical protein